MLDKKEKKARNFALICSVLFPIIGTTLYFVYKKEEVSAIAYVYTVLAGVVLGFILWGIYFIRKRMKARKEADLKWEKERQERLAREKALEFDFQVRPVYYRIPQHQLRFHPREEEVFYYEKNEQPDCRQIIEEHWDEIGALLKKYSRELIYLPGYRKTMDSRNLPEKKSYWFPGAEQLEVGRQIAFEDFARELSIPEDVDYASLIRCMGLKDGIYTFSIKRIESHCWEDFEREIYTYGKSTYLKPVMYRLATDKEIDQYLKGKCADERFDTDVCRLGREIRDRIAQLQEKGVDEMVIRILLGDFDPELSRLRIDSHRNIYLEDYHQLKIELSPVQKAVYFLFLNHPEGIYFKELANYESELLEIYSSLSTKDNPEDIRATVKRLVDPFDNSINEKCARIRNAFVSVIDAGTAKYYCIDGKKGERKRIPLDRKLLIEE